MNKELTPLEAFYLVKTGDWQKEKVNPKTCIDIVETALKDCANLKRDYEFLSEHYNELMADYNEQDKLLKKKNDDYIDKINTINRKLKALEIIKEKEVNVIAFRSCCITQNLGVEVYNKWDTQYNYQLLTQEEFDLLKEVLK